MIYIGYISYVSIFSILVHFWLCYYVTVVHTISVLLRAVRFPPCFLCHMNDDRFVLISDDKAQKRILIYHSPFFAYSLAYSRGVF